MGRSADRQAKGDIRGVVPGRARFAGKVNDLQSMDGPTQ